MTDEGGPRRTRLYGAVDLPDPTIDETGALPAQPGLSPGECLEHYRIDGVLGRGGMGEVLSAKDEQIGRPVAIKRLRVANPSAHVLDRFLREVRIQARLEHPAIVPVYGLYEDVEQPFFVMKHLAGTTLAEVIERLARGADAKAFSRQHLLRAFVDVCLALELAHARGVVHRDVKPANVVLGDFGEVYVLDWGIARVIDDKPIAGFGDVDTLDEKTSVGSFVGTPGYVAPEQIAGAPDIDGRADVYSLGCVLFEILALEPLHPRGQGALASALITTTDARPSSRAADKDIPPELDAICTRATHMDRDQRFPSARALADAVQAYLDGDRDNSLRNTLAKTELDNAFTALATDATDGRRAAMRAAARSLALDPTYRPAADLVGHLMLDPPKEAPAEVEAELDVADLETTRRSARFGTFAALSYLAFFPILYWVGFREAWYLIAGPALCGVIVLGTAILTRWWPMWPRYIAIFGNFAIFALFSSLVSPVVFGLGPPIILIGLLASQRKLIPLWLVAVLSVTAVMTPFALSWAGVLPPIVSASGNDLVLHTLATDLDASTVTIALFIYIPAIAALAALLARLQDNDRRDVQRRIQLQTWQLRQLVPRALTSA